jgi:hypothetical protein
MTPPPERRQGPGRPNFRLKSVPAIATLPCPRVQQTMGTPGHLDKPLPHIGMFRGFGRT